MKINYLLFKILKDKKDKFPDEKFWNKFWKLKLKEIMWVFAIIIIYFILFFIPSYILIKNHTNYIDGVPILKKDIGTYSSVDTMQSHIYSDMMRGYNADEALKRLAECDEVNFEIWKINNVDRYAKLKFFLPKYFYFNGILLLIYMGIVCILLLIYLWFRINYKKVKLKIKK